LNERLVHTLLVENRYERHVQGLRERLLACRTKARAFLQRHGVDIFAAHGDGLFLWADMHTDTNVLATIWREQGLLLAPGSLFSPSQAPTTWMRFNVTTPLDERVTRMMQAAAHPV
jgi:DNA-binding transcriptional MocR family regulator